MGVGEVRWGSERLDGGQIGKMGVREVRWGSGR